MSVVRNLLLAGLGLGMAVLTPGAAVAANGYATATVNERAGPSTGYPVVTIVPAGAGVTIYGCLSDIAWCDVAYAGTRGWVQGDYLQALYEAHRVAVPAYAPRLGIPFITFNIGVYWDNYYRHRPFYGERARFARLHEGAGAIVYRNKSGGAVVVTKGKKPRYAVSAHPKQFANVVGSKQPGFIKPDKGRKQKAVKVKGMGKPPFSKGKGANKGPPKKCIVRAGRQTC
jgi:uncharacterized protein YraI